MFKKKIAQTKNLIKLTEAFQMVKARTVGSPGFLLLYGEPGLGKTTAAGQLYVENDGLLITALPGMTQRYLVERLIHEMGGGKARRSTVDATDQCIDILNKTPKAIFIDELDQLFWDKRVLETLRLIHDLTSCPILLAGMTGVERQIFDFKQLSSRIFQNVRFDPADLGDARALAEAVCSVGVADDLLKELFEQAKGNYRDMRVALNLIESFGKKKELESVDAKAWGGKQLFFRQGGR